MDYLSKFQKSIQNYIFFTFLVIVAFSIVVILLADRFLTVNIELFSFIIIVINFPVFYFSSSIIARKVVGPIGMIQQAVLYVSRSEHGFQAPKLQDIKIGKEIINNIILQIYQIASSAPENLHPAKTKSQRTKSGSILENFPLPILVLDKHSVVVYANQPVASFLEMELDEIFGKNIYAILDMSFNSDKTFDRWLNDVKHNNVTATQTWERVRLLLNDQETRKQLDMVAYYNRDNPDDIETIITLYDRSKFYGREDEGIDFIALAVHELRTPITMLRGYIEIFEEELEGRLDSELEDYMKKMHVSGQQLSDFVGNILNVVRVDENQLFLQLHAESWEQVLREAAKDMELKASVHHKHIEFNIQPNMPPVAVDKVSIYEVVNNILDNAIKYSIDSNKIIVSSSLREDGVIETTIQDFGIGMPGSVVGKLFEKFYRNHRTRAQIGGTGLGLYLSKAIISAHDGQIWVNSKEGKGSTFGFTLQTYDKLADKLKNTDNRDISRTAHGWIKNHSFYKR